MSWFLVVTNRVVCVSLVCGTFAVLLLIHFPVGVSTEKFCNINFDNHSANKPKTALWNGERVYLGGPNWCYMVPHWFLCNALSP